jgi:hypothetical protein
MTEIAVHLPRPHPKQAAFIDSAAKRRVIVAGRRGGKTTGTSILAARKFLEGRRILDAAPTQDQTDTFWDACKRYFAEAIERKAIYKNETKRMLEAPNGGRIRAKTAWDADSLRGDYADLLILEEYSLMDPGAWDEVGSPMLLDNDGDAVFIFTPMRRNHAFTMYNRAVSDDSGRWAHWHFTSHDNPHLSQSALAEITADMTEDAYRQEILAEFLEGEGAVFRNIAACLHAPNDDAPGQHAAHNVVMGVDWGKHQDFTALSVFCGDCRRELAHERFNQIDYAVQRGRLAALATRWKVRHILAEANSVGEPIIEQLQREGLPVSGFMTTPSSKPPLIESLALAFEREEAQWLNDPTWNFELEAYERKVSTVTGRSQYSAPEGVHDDTVIARALAWQAVTGTPATYGYSY